MTFVILSGGIDLSVGSVIAFTGVFLAKVIGDFWPLAAAGVSASAGDGLCLWRIYGAFDRRPEDPGIYHYPRQECSFCAASAISVSEESIPIKPSHL